MNSSSPAPTDSTIEIRRLGLADYRATWAAMKEYTTARLVHSPDQLWVCEHPPVYTLGQAGRRHHIHQSGDIPIVETDRGGQVTYHGPGQVVVYCLIDLRRAGYGVRELVTRLESSTIDLLSDYRIEARSRRDAPGVYVGQAKIAALGLRIRRGCSYHGIALNIDPDLEPFSRIDPCGYQGLEVTSLQALDVPCDRDAFIEQYALKIREKLAAPV